MNTTTSLLASANHENTPFLIVSLNLTCALSPSNTHQLGTPDTQSQLDNRVANGNLLRYVDAMRTHGHRAAHIDPLNLIHREEVAALSPERYGLTDPEQKFNVDGILWTKRVGEAVEGGGEEWWTLGEIRDHLRRVYVGNIAYEVCTECYPSSSLMS